MTTATPSAETAPGPEPTAPDATPSVARETKRGGEQAALALFIGIPFLALLAAVPVAWGWGLGWHDIVIALVMYAIAGHGITVGFHRHFTHGSFKASRGLKVALAVAGSMAIQGPVVRWVADHRRHHAFSDRDGDPHSPWRYGETIPALAKGLWWAHTGWLFDVEQTPRSKYAPDLMADTDLQKVDRAFPLIVAGSMLFPALVGGLWSMSWQGALTAFFWASLVRVSLLHHVTWSINSICHTIGERPFKSRDRSGNVWWLAVLSMGESWHNLHHADPTCARHGIEKGQLDSTARVIWAFEKLGWATDVRWPVAKRIAARRVTTA
ncbi:acyl-CoA desaturase [Pedococcus bigeumensis]|uniref:Acyl-CoA desaturase n=1 Tax=Pedococcus bigeumensis TaxID=433644 RepID=A0A502CM09_9MICO|nr:fatty acid desaturase [Pedococcus bigeumensis]TPG13863.1 acyl-CoA desaturase [Pedococcus bigeumensis]